MTASIWLAIPNIGQIAPISLALMKYAQPRTISAVLTIAPGHQSVLPSCG